MSYDTTCSDYIPGSLKDTDRYIEVADGHHIRAKKKGQVQIKMRNNNRYTFIATLYNVILAPDLCDRLFSIIKILNLVHTCLFHKGFCVVYFKSKEKMGLLYHIGNMHFGEE